MSQPSVNAQQSLADLVALLDLEPLGSDIFRGRAPKDRWQRVFGGQVLGQSIMAAMRTIEARVCHSMHAYFLWPGDPRHPITYQVERTRDGGTFSARRVSAIQNERTIFVMAASFQIVEEGFDHQAPMPQVPPPEAVKSEREIRLEIASDLPDDVRTWKEKPLDLRPVLPLDRFKGGKHPPQQILWLRAVAPLPDDPVLHKAVLAYASDMTLLDTSLMPHGVNLFSRNMQVASLDHALWFHRPVKADEWLLYVQDSPSASGGRGFNRGLIYQQDGTLVASVAQEGLIRKRK